jgi:hypothetical protein
MFLNSETSASTVVLLLKIQISNSQLLICPNSQNVLNRLALHQN